jgi:UDP-N-acetylglucosamine:LPS N-acetylglucosamine transferase
VPVAEPPAGTSARGRLAQSYGLRSRFTVFSDVQEGGTAVAAELAAAGMQVIVRGGASMRRRPDANVFAVAEDESPATLVAASDLVLCSPCGSMMWEAPAAGVPLVVVEPITPMERSSIDLLTTAGAALVARDGVDAVRRAAFLDANPDRLASMCRDAAWVGRPAAARAVCERALTETA